MEQRFITLKDAAQYLGLSNKTLYKWVFKRTIPFCKFGAAVRFDKLELDGFIEASRRGTNVSPGIPVRGGAVRA
jgi:excisionase family DNA binding protein